MDLFLLFESLAGKRHIEITDQRRRVEWAEVMRIVSDELYPEAEKIVVVQDNLVDRRIPDKETLIREVKAWQDQRNSEVIKVQWQFTTADARIKLRNLYPKFQL